MFLEVGFKFLVGEGCLSLEHFRSQLFVDVPNIRGESVGQVLFQSEVISTTYLVYLC